MALDVESTYDTREAGKTFCSRSFSHFCNFFFYFVCVLYRVPKNVLKKFSSSHECFDNPLF